MKRLSKPDDDERPRLVWVKLGSRVQRNKVMKYKTKLRWSNVFVTTDMTKNERHEDYTPQKEVKERRKKGERVQIQAGKVVQVQETAQKSEQKKEEASRAAFKQADIGISLANNVTAEDKESTVYANHKTHCYNEHNTHIHCILLNARSIVRKVDELKLLVHEENSDIIFITESWTTEHIGKAEINIPGYDVIRKDRIIIIIIYVYFRHIK